MVIAVQNSQQNKKKEIVELNFGINYTLQQTIAMLKILNVVFNVSRNSTVCERVINSQKRSFLHERAH